jgi:glycosyltransferase involved in cell wall biosynthesis
MKFKIITRCTRTTNLLTIQQSVFNSKFDVEWHIIFDNSVLKDISVDLLTNLQNPNTIFHFVTGEDGDLLYPQSSKIVSQFTEGWVYYLDDDNIIHENFYEEISKTIESNKDKKVFIVAQQVNGKDFTGLYVREALPQHTKHQHIDIAQLLIKYSVFKQYSFIGDYSADGYFVEKVYSEKPEWFFWDNRILSYYNYLSNSRKPILPKILYVGKNKPKLTTSFSYDYEAKELNTLYLEDDTNFDSALIGFKPDAIVGITDDWKKFPNISKHNLEVRNKWITLSKDTANIGDYAYNCAMGNILREKDNNFLISFITPIYNTGKKLYRTYESLTKQTYPDWEWVIVNDSSDEGKTLKIAESIASKDPRVKVYDFREKTKGIVGESKYRAFMLSNGYILAELDHDDYLVPTVAEDLHNAAQAFPNSGFFYTDCAEVNEQWESSIYPDGFCFGYGNYRTEVFDGKILQVVNEANINPKTIRHIVGVPNHVRAWRRDTYFKIGGHNRQLPIADDYEILVRTFLETTFVKIPKLGYIQFIYNNGFERNTHDLSRDDIQRRVRTIMYYYNDRIAKRFQELGVEDWAYDANPDFPLDVPSRFGKEERHVNYIYTE